MELKKIVRLSMFAAIMVALSIVESYIPIFNGSIPGFKLGLANIIVIILLYLYSFKDALYVSILRIFIVGLLRTGLFSTTFIFSISGAILSLIMMFLFKKTKLSIIGVSIVGSVSHSIGQILAATIILQNINLNYYLPFMIIFSIITGIIIGIISKEIVNHLKEIL